MIDLGTLMTPETAWNLKLAALFVVPAITWWVGRAIETRIERQSPQWRTAWYAAMFVALGAVGITWTITDLRSALAMWGG